MSSPELANLERAGLLKREAPAAVEIEGLARSGEKRLIDARNETLALESRFDLAYNSAHALALAALRWHGYRSENRYLVFQALEHTLGLAPALWRVLAKAHQHRNRAEYEGYLDVDEVLLRDLLAAAEVVRGAVRALGPISTSSM